METSVLEALLEELVDIPLHENEEHDERQGYIDKFFVFVQGYIDKFFK